jgi:hypothetical protein
MSFAIQSEYAFLNIAVRHAGSLGENQIRRQKRKKEGLDGALCAKQAA